MDQMLLHKFVEFMSAQVHVVIKAKKKKGDVPNTTKV